MSTKRRRSATTSPVPWKKHKPNKQHNHDSDKHAIAKRYDHASDQHEFEQIFNTLISINSLTQYPSDILLAIAYNAAGAIRFCDACDRDHERELLCLRSEPYRAAYSIDEYIVSGRTMWTSKYIYCTACIAERNTKNWWRWQQCFCCGFYYRHDHHFYRVLPHKYLRNGVFVVTKSTICFEKGERQLCENCWQNRSFSGQACYDCNILLMDGEWPTCCECDKLLKECCEIAHSADCGRTYCNDCCKAQRTRYSCDVGNVCDALCCAECVDGDHDPDPEDLTQERLSGDYY